MQHFQGEAFTVTVPGIAGRMRGELVVRILGNVGIAAEVFESVPEGMEYDIVREPQVFVNIAVEPAAQHFTVVLVSASGLEKGPQAFLSAGFDGFHMAGNWFDELQEMRLLFRWQGIEELFQKRALPSCNPLKAIFLYGKSGS